MKTNRLPICLPGLILSASFAAALPAAELERTLPRWFEDHRVQAHFENATQDDLAGLYQELHPTIRSMGAEVLTRIFKTTAEGAWWPTAAGYTHELLGERVSPHLASTRPLRFALIHVSERSRNARIADPRALWVEFFAPVLGAFETLKEAPWPVATINDLQLERRIPAETRVVILPHWQKITDAQRSVLTEFESAGGTIVRLDTDRGWHGKAEKPQRKQDLLARITAAIESPPVRARGPAALHVVFFQTRRQGPIQGLAAGREPSIPTE